MWWQIAYHNWILPQNEVYLSRLSCVYIVVVNIKIYPMVPFPVTLSDP